MSVTAQKSAKESVLPIQDLRVRQEATEQAWIAFRETEARAFRIRWEAREAARKVCSSALEQAEKPFLEAILSAEKVREDALARVAPES